MSASRQPSAHEKRNERLWNEQSAGYQAKHEPSSPPPAGPRGVCGSCRSRSSGCSAT